MWKKKFGRCIYESPSGYKVYQNFLYRWLTLGSSALQTVINRRHPQKPVLSYIPALTLPIRHHPKPACLLGLGGAGIPLMLADLPPSLVAVELSEEIIDIGKRFFMINPPKNLTVVHANAMDFVQKNNATYFHLMVDLYDANHFPSECANDLFFSSCRILLDKEGFLSVNLANPKEQWALFKLIAKQFTHTLIIPIKKTANMVIIASNTKNKEFFLHQLDQSGELKRIIWVESWGYVGEIIR